MTGSTKLYSILIVILTLLCACGTNSVPEDLNVMSIKRFSAYPATVTEGEMASLSWQVEGVETGSVFINPGNVALPNEGSLKVLPGYSTTYTLSANKNGRTVQETLVVTVSPIDEPVDEGNAAPEISAVNQNLSVSGPEILELNLEASDPDGDALEWHINIGASKGYADIDANGLVRYQAFPGESGSDTLAIEVSDGAASDVLELNIAIF